MSCVVSGGKTPTRLAVDIDSGVAGVAVPAEDVESGSPSPARSPVDVGSGSLVGAEPQADVDSGSLIASKPGASIGPNYPRISWENQLYKNSNANSDDANTSLAKNLTTYDTWQRFTAAGGSAVVVIAPVAGFTADHVAIAGHNLQDVAGAITVDVDGGSGYFTVGTVTGSSRSTAALFEFAPVTLAAIRLTMMGGGGLPVSLSNVFSGEILVMERPTYAGVTPASLSSKTVYKPANSDGGQFLGRQLVRRGVEMSASFRHLSDAWVRSDFDPFARHAQLKPFFYAWNMEEDPDGVVYGWAQSDIIPTKMGVNDLLECSFDITGHR